MANPHRVDTIPGTSALAAAGQYFTASNATPGTALAFAVNATVSETAGNFINVSNSAAAGGKRIHLHYVKLIVGVAPASAASAHFFLKTDSAARFTSGGATLTNVPCSTDSGAAGNAVVNAGALTTATASAAARLITRGVIRASIPIVNDAWIFTFGAPTFADPIGLAAAAAQRTVLTCPPVVLAGGHNASVQLWFPSNATTAGSFEVEVGWWEK